MSLAVVAFPVLSAADHGWIEQERRRHDLGLAGRIAAHFTLVFPTEAMSTVSLSRHVRDLARASQAIPFVLRRARAVAEPLGSHHLVYLLPEEGSAEISALHDRLYGGPLAEERRDDLPYLPHMTVGRAIKEADCRAQAERLNQRGLAVAGRLDALELISVETHGTTELARFALG